MAARKVTTKKLTEPKSAVKVKQPFSSQTLRFWNSEENARVANTSKNAAAERARQENFQNIRASVLKPTVVKINSATPTRQGTTPAPRRAGGLMGGTGAGNWRNMFK